MKVTNNHNLTIEKIWFLTKQKSVYFRLYDNCKTCHTLPITHKSIKSSRLSTFESGS